MMNKGNGGEDFTYILYKMFLEKINIKEDDLDNKTIAHIKKQCEKAKLNFSNNKIISVKCNISDNIYESSIHIDDYRKSCELILSKLRKPIEKSLKDSKTRLSEIDEIILVGGGTKLPIIRKFVGKIFGRVPNISINPDEAVVRGVALQCAIKERDKYIKEVVLTDVCPFSLGIEISIEHRGNIRKDGYFTPIIERNTVIPVSRTERFYTTYDNQNRVLVQGCTKNIRENIELLLIIF